MPRAGSTGRPPWLGFCQQAPAQAEAKPADSDKESKEAAVKDKAAQAGEPEAKQGAVAVKKRKASRYAKRARTAPRRHARRPFSRRLYARYYSGRPYLIPPLALMRKHRRNAR
jgi:hypothetical protein